MSNESDISVLQEGVRGGPGEIVNVEKIPRPGNLPPKAPHKTTAPAEVFAEDIVDASQFEDTSADIREVIDAKVDVVAPVPPVVKPVVEEAGAPLLLDEIVGKTTEIDSDVYGEDIPLDVEEHVLDPLADIRQIVEPPVVVAKAVPVEPVIPEAPPVSVGDILGDDWAKTDRFKVPAELSSYDSVLKRHGWEHSEDIIMGSHVYINKAVFDYQTSSIGQLFVAGDGKMWQHRSQHGDNVASLEKHLSNIILP